ncbi:unnamed protein product [Rotaria sp. Silwood1]|nr:unnamed protein product [Rotaria sp. Silwood1]CAF1539238.1 unnamed protein product [Rotaria sp. Silwood1]
MVIGQLNPAVGLHIIHLEEIDSPITFVKPPFENFSLTSKPIQNKPTTDKQHLPVQNGNHVMLLKPKTLAAQYSPPMKTFSSAKLEKIKTSINEPHSLVPDSHFRPPLKPKVPEGKYYLFRNRVPLVAR